MNDLQSRPAPPSVHVPELDEQHKRLFAIIHQAEQLNKKGHSSDEIFQLLKDLVDYSGYHFRTEDAYMLDNRYPLFQAHRKEHGQYLKQLSVILTRFENKDERMLEGLNQFLSEWWRRHVLESDMQYARYFKNNPPEVSTGAGAPTDG